MLQRVLGEERRDAYALVRDLQNFSLVCKTWRDAAATTVRAAVCLSLMHPGRRPTAVLTDNAALTLQPLRISLEYMVELQFSALRWLQRMTIADLVVNPSGCPLAGWLCAVLVG